MRKCERCDRTHYAKGLCIYHYAREREKEKERKCSCGEGHYAKGFCYKHYHQYQRRKTGHVSPDRLMKGLLKNQEETICQK